MCQRKNAVVLELKESTTRKSCRETNKKNNKQSAKLMAVGLLANCQDVDTRQGTTQEKCTRYKYYYCLTTCVARSEHTSRTQHNFKNITVLLKYLFSKRTLTRE